MFLYNSRVIPITKKPILDLFSRLKDFKLLGNAMQVFTIAQKVQRMRRNGRFYRINV